MLTKTMSALACIETDVQINPLPGSYCMLCIFGYSIIMSMTKDVPFELQYVLIDSWQSSLLFRHGAGFASLDWSSMLLAQRMSWLNDPSFYFDPVLRAASEVRGHLFNSVYSLAMVSNHSLRKHMPTLHWTAVLPLWCARRYRHINLHLGSLWWKHKLYNGRGVSCEIPEFFGRQQENHSWLGHSANVL